MALLEAHVGGQYLSPRVLGLALQFVSAAAEMKATYAVIQPHMDALMLRVAFPLMCFDEQDAELWREDPQEYVRRVS